MKQYCEVCGKEVETKIITKKESYKVFGESIEVEAKILTCSDCGEELFCKELDSATLSSVYDEYRRRHKLLFADEIKNIREQYGLSQRSFAKLLNWGDKTICRYENGCIQDKAHNSLLLLLRKPENMRTYLKENEISLNERQKQKLLENIDKLEQDREFHERKIIDLYFSNAPSEENGFKVFDYDKFCAMVLFFAHKSKELLKTKLMKLLNYSDMIFYQENGVSISGIRYMHYPYGPVPRRFDILLDTISLDHVAHIEISSDDNGYERHQVIPDDEVPEGVLSEKELDVMERVYERFADFGSVKISSYSHKERGYISTKDGEIIPYSYAKYIKLD